MSLRGEVESSGAERSLISRRWAEPLAASLAVVAMRTNFSPVSVIVMAGTSPAMNNALNSA